MFQIFFPIFFIVLLAFIFIKNSSSKALFGSEARQLGSVSYKQWGVTTTVNVHELMKRNEEGEKIVGLEIRRTHATGFNIGKMELNPEQTHSLIAALQKAVD